MKGTTAMQIQEPTSCQTKCSLLKQNLQKIRQSITQGNTGSDPLQPFQNLMRLRQLFRDVAKQLQIRKLLAKTKKEQIDKSRAHLDGLEYCKVVLQAQIDICKVDVTDVSDVIEEQTQIDWRNGFEQVKNNLVNWIEQSKTKKQLLNEKKLEMSRMESKLNTQRNFYRNQMPLQLKKISENLLAITTLFGVEPVHLLNPVKNSKLKALYSYFQPLKQSGVIAMEYLEEAINIKITMKASHQAFKLFSQIKCPVQQKNIEIKFLIIQGDTLVASVDRSSDLNNEEIFHRLVNDQAATKLYENPKNQEQRNSNNRFVRFKWLDEIASAKLNLQINGASLLKKIQDRVISLLLTRYLLLSLKDSKFLFYFRTIRQGESGTVHLKKFNVQSLTKLSFQNFQKGIFVPIWVKNLSYLQVQNQNQRETQSFKPQDSFVSLPSEYLSDYNFGENEQTQRNQYYKVILNYHQNTITFVIIIPHCYPQKPSKIKILQISKKKEDRKLVPLPHTLMTINPQAGSRNSTLSEIRAELFQNQLNSNINDFVMENYHFHVFYQINRLLTILQESVTRDTNSDLVVTPLYDI